jgi:hypothetical protein
MQPDELIDDDFDLEEEDSFEAEDWDEETLGLDADMDSDSIAREIGLRR